MTWDRSTAAQRANRAHITTGRGEIDPETGEMRNPNGVAGVHFFNLLEVLYGARFLGVRHMQAAQDYAHLARCNLGRPGPRSILDDTPRGHDDEEAGPSASERRRWGIVRLALSREERAELDAWLWETDGHPRRGYALTLRAGLEKVADALDD